VYGLPCRHLFVSVLPSQYFGVRLLCSPRTGRPSLVSVLCVRALELQALVLQFATFVRLELLLTPHWELALIATPLRFRKCSADGSDGTAKHLTSC